MNITIVNVWLFVIFNKKTRIIVILIQNNGFKITILWQIQIIRFLHLIIVIYLSILEK